MDQVKRRTIKTPVGDLVLDRASLMHVLDGPGHREQFSNLIIPTLSNPFEIWGVDYGDHIRQRYIGLFRRSRRQRPVLSILRENTDGSLRFITWIPKDLGALNKERIGTLLWGGNESAGGAAE